jgi:hypothetical protein
LISSSHSDSCSSLTYSKWQSLPKEVAKSRGDNIHEREILDWHLSKRHLLLLLENRSGHPHNHKATWHMHKRKQMCQQTAWKTKQNVGWSIRCVSGLPASVKYKHPELAIGGCFVHTFWIISLHKVARTQFDDIVLSNQKTY